MRGAGDTAIHPRRRASPCLLLGTARTCRLVGSPAKSCLYGGSNGEMMKGGKVMTKTARKFEAAQRASRAVGGVIAVITALMSLAFMYVVIWAVRFIMTEGHTYQDGLITGEMGESLHIPAAALWLVIVGLILVSLFLISLDVLRGRSPFSGKHTALITVLGVAFLLNMVLAGVWGNGYIQIGSASPMLWLYPNSVILYLGAGRFPLDVGSLAAALFCFAIAAFWQYGTLLQQQSDDLV